MRRRQYAAVTLAMPMLLAACIAPGRTGPPAASDVATCPVDLLDQRGDGEEPVAVTFWYNEIAEPEAAITELVARYNESQDRVVVTAHNQGPELYEKYESAIGTSGLPDVAEIYDDKTLAAVGSETLLPAQACMEEAGFDVDDIDPVIRSYYTVNGVYWPEYVGPNEPVLYLNASHFERAGLDPDDPIDTLDELYAAAKALKAAGVSDKPLSVADGGPVLDWIAAAGEIVVDNNNGRDATPTESTFDNPATRAVYTWLAKLRDEGLILTGPWPDHLLALSSQTSSMTVDVTGTATSIEAFLAGGEGDIVPGVGPFPTITATAPVAGHRAARSIWSTNPSRSCRLPRGSSWSSCCKATRALPGWRAARTCRSSSPSTSIPW